MPELSNLFDLGGRVAVVTGGVGLLGVEFCKTLAKAGAAVVIADVDGKSATEIAESLNRDSFRALGLETDVTRLDSVHRMVSAVLEKFGRLDILVNSAAVDPKFDLEHIGVREEGAEKKRSLTNASIPFEKYPLELWNQALA
ncbi:MAG: SDR family NAD(P)-dependent oxidoreductase, partial [Anaerolineales bacterium]